jgi:hypothetical protein
VFAYHPISDDTADHRDPLQWQFHVVRTAKLPMTHTIGLPAIKVLSPALPWGEIFDAVEKQRFLL